MKKRVYVIIIFLIVSFITRHLSSQELPFRHFTPDNEINPLPGAAVTAVYQDKTGYIWFAVYGTGLVRYDGHRMEVFTPEEGASTYVFSIKQDNIGRLWASGSEGVIISESPLASYLPGEKIKFTSQIDDMTLPGTRLVHRDQLYVDDHGNIWIPTDEAIIRYHYASDEKIVADTISLALILDNKRRVSCISSLADGTICAISDSKYMIFVGPNSLKVDTVLFDKTSDATGKAATRNLLLDRSGTLWGSRNNGEVWKLAPGDTTVNPSTTTMVNGLAVKVILETKEGQFLVGSLGGGLIEFDRDDLEHPVMYTPKNGMLSPVIWDLMQDREGNIWIATNSGLSRLPGDYKAFGHYTTNSTEGAPNMLPESGVIAMLPEMEWKDGEKPLLVAGTGGGISFIRNGNERQILKVEDGLLDNTVLDLSIDERGRIWIVGRKGITCLSKEPGLLQLPGFDEARKIWLWDVPFYIASMPFIHIDAAVVTTLAQSAGDDQKIETILLLGGSSVLVFAGEQFYYLPPELFLQRESFRSIAFDGRGYLYVGDQSQGMLRSKFPLTAEKLASLEYTSSTNPRFNGIRSISEPMFIPHQLFTPKDTVAMVSSFLWLDSVMWSGNEHGIVVLSGDSLVSHTHLSVEDGLKGNGAVGFIYDSRSALLWAATFNGLVGIDPVSKKIRRTVEKKDGLVDDLAWGFPSIEMSHEGILYFGTSRGLSIYNPLLDEPDTMAPVVVLRDFQLVENKGENNTLEIEYAALSYTYEQGIRYQTRLLGFDSDWTQDTKDTRIRFTNLPALWAPKTYHFEVRAHDESGNVMETPLSYAFEVKPSWYLTWWAFTIYFLLLAGMVFIYVRWRTAALKRRQRQLETTVTERTAEIVRQKDIILNEKERSEELLLNILPAEVAEELKISGSSPARSFDEVTVLFTDIKEFTYISEQLTATELVAEINICFQAFDKITSEYGIEKIKTIGDAYLAAGGLNVPRKTEPKNVVLAALAMQKFVQERRRQNQQRGAVGFEMRCGIHTGPVVAGIVGIKKFQYDIWGDTVNTAARMESSGEVGQVNISENTYRLLANDPQFTFVNRGKINAKNKGEIHMYFVEEKP